MQDILNPNDKNQVSTNEEEAMSQVSLRKGYWFFFDDEGDDISIHGSAWSGKETVYFNNKKVSEIRNITSRSGTHHFEAKQHSYKVEFQITSLRQGTLEVRVFKDGHLLGQESASIQKKPVPWWHYLVYATVGACLGFAMAAYFS
jgi:hypothetical protein